LINTILLQSMSEVRRETFEEISSDTNFLWAKIAKTIDALNNNELLIEEDITIDEADRLIKRLQNELALLGCLVTHENIATITNTSMLSSLHFDHRSNVIQLRLHPNLDSEDQTDTKKILLLQELFRQRLVAIKILQSAGLTTFNARYGKLPNQDVFNEVKNQIMPDVIAHLNELTHFPTSS